MKTDASAENHTSLQTYWVRHTAVMPAMQKICYGHSDVELKETFEQEAEIVKNNIAGIQADEIFSSPLSRAKRLASYCGFTDTDIDTRLIELNFGEWEMKTWTELQGNEEDWDPDFFLPYLTRKTPGGESVMDQYLRVLDFIKEKMPAEGKRSIMMFCHGGVINAARVAAGLAELRHSFSHLPPYGSITKITFTPQMLQKAEELKQ
ncbi:histidine phosphatase family protein [Porphyromonas macacae]|uniref:Bifunctional RNase H/acid phosphatase n=1 Tax=Porphyromonas macacae TaxID=28115 RepID=A0A379DHF8_9PORP|nr:histidine phosphatase family protein [Porphyromonas macacae]SUB77145.1 bifunctional RNase H/acid phosphatase [Porphyromonas macacae]